MATKIRALCKFSNERYLSHLSGATIETGETAQVVDHYAQKLRKRGLVEIVEDENEADADAEAGTDAEVDADSTPEPDASTADAGADTEEEPTGDWALGESAGAGFYYARYDGERVDNADTTSGYDTVGKGKADAQAEIDRRNEEGLTPADVLSA